MLLNAIKTKEELAALLGVSFRTDLVYYLQRMPDDQKYRPFQIRKRSGGHRTIKAPHHGLKRVQKRLAKLLDESYRARGGVHGFVAGRSIITNAKAHVRKSLVLNIDLKHFFEAINFGRVRGILQSPVFGANQEVATFIAKICCFENSLPQGAPTSPVISNMICGKLDANMKALAREFSCAYTRYCDDITLSCNSKVFPSAVASIVGQLEGRKIELGERLRDIVNINGFEINEGKTRLLSRADRQEVTGLVTNRFVNVPRKYIRNLRATLHDWRKSGLEAASLKFSERYEARTREKANFESVIFGRVQYVGAVRGFDDGIYRKLRTIYNQLSSIQIPLHSSSREFTLENGVWVIESDSENVDELSQGTAFFLDGVGLVTCAHCLGPGRNFIYKPSVPSATWDVEVVAKSDDIDLAVIRVVNPGFVPPASFRPSNDSNGVQRSDRVTLAGWPQYGPGSELSVKEGQVQSIKHRSGIRRFNISAPIIGGNSGGPVFNLRGQVIGVAVTGGATLANALAEEAQGVIPISALGQIPSGG